MREVDARERLHHRDTRRRAIHGRGVQGHPSTLRCLREANRVVLADADRLVRIDGVGSGERVRIRVKVQRRERGVRAASVVNRGPAVDAVTLRVQERVDAVAKSGLSDGTRRTRRHTTCAREPEREQQDRREGTFQTVMSSTDRRGSGTPSPKSV